MYSTRVQCSVVLVQYDDTVALYTLALASATVPGPGAGIIYHGTRAEEFHLR